MKNLKNEITIRLVTNDFGILVRNGVDLICPLVPPLQFRQIKQGSSLIGGQPQGEIGIQKTACNSGCPLFHINDNDTVEIFCGGQIISHKIKEVITVEKQMEKKPDNILNLKIDKSDKSIN